MFGSRLTAELSAVCVYRNVLPSLPSLPSLSSHPSILVLLEGIHKEYCQRAHYVAYLVGLQQTLADARTRISELLKTKQRYRRVGTGW